MKAVGLYKYLPIDNKESLIDVEIDRPHPKDNDLLVKVQGISVNPVDTKIRSPKDQTETTPRVLGWDAAGEVIEVGSNVSSFAIGDQVFYAGDIIRAGSNCEYQLVDERIVGRKPTSLSFAEAAGFPLTSITAWEILFDSFRIKEGDGKGESLLIIGGAGGVGSILIQLAKKLTGLTVIATASRPETIEWVKKMGADHVINHRESLLDQIKALGLESHYVASLTGTDQHFPAIIELIKPRGYIAVIDDPETLDIKSGKFKALTFSWEFMFTRSMFQMDDIEKQQELLNRVSALIDEGTLISTVTNNLGIISAETLREAHSQQESGRVIGKNVLDGFFTR
jgi:NADPH:quinone reductase